MNVTTPLFGLSRDKGLLLIKTIGSDFELLRNVLKASKCNRSVFASVAKVPYNST